MRSIKLHPHLISLLFIFLELLLAVYLFVRLLYVQGDRKNWLPLAGLLLLIFYNGTLGWLNDIFWQIVVNMVALVGVCVLMLVPLFTMQKKEEVVVDLMNPQRYLENCRVYKLSVREIEVCNLVCKGYRNKQIAQDLFISEKTVENHLQNIYAKVGERGKLALIAKLNR